MSLCERDEALHEPPHPLPQDWQENLFFILWDVRGDHGFMAHVQRVPSLGWQEVQMVVSVAGQLVSVSRRGTFAPDALPDGVTMTAERPFERWRISTTMKGAQGPGPLGFIAMSPNCDTFAAVDVQLDAVLAPVDFADGLASIVARLRSDAGGPQMEDQQHYEQGGTWRGHLQAGDTRVSAEGLFVRDHSWGRRHEQNSFKAFWTASCLEGGAVFCNAIGIVQPGAVVGVGAVADAAGVRFTDEVDARLEPLPGLGCYSSATVTYGSGVDQVLRAHTLRHLPMYLPHSGPRRYDNNAISSVSMGGQAGFGVIEWATVLDAEQMAAIEGGLPLADDGVAPHIAMA